MSDRIERIIDALRKKILESAIRGELVPQNPADEPASTLLERIAEERERLIKEKKIKKPKSSSRIFRRDGLFYESINGGEPTCIEDDIPFKIPDSWEWIRLSNILSVSSGKVLPSNELEDNGAYPVYGGNGIVGHYSSNNVDSGTLLIGRVGALCGNTHITKSPAWVTDNALICAFDSSKIHIDYLRIVIDSLELRQKSNSTAQPVITGKIIYPSLIPLPPYSEQYRIIQGIEHRLGVLLLIKDSRSRYKRILSETPTSLRQQLIQAAIQGQLVPQNPSDEPASVLLERIAQERTAKLGKKAAKSVSRIERRGSKTYELFPDGSEKDISDDIPFDIPDSWEWCRLSYISYGLQYGTSQKSNSTGKYAVLRMGNIQNGEIDFSDLVYSNNDVDFSKLELKKGDVLFNRTNSPEWVGKTAIFRNHKTPCIFAGYLIRINQSELIVGAYLNYFLNSSSARKQGDAVVSLAVNQANISGKKLSDYFIPIPPLSEQHRIVDKLDALLKLV